MGKEKIALAICFCLIVVLAGFSTLSYLEAKGLDSKVSDLESRTSDLETENAELNEKVQDLTDWRNSFPEELKIINVEFLSGNKVNITMQNTGTSPITITAIHINNGNNLLSSSQIIQENSELEQQVTFSWTDGSQYQIKVVTSRGNQYYYNVVAPASSGVMLYKANVNFYGDGTKINIDIGNSGDSNTQIIKVYIGTAPESLVEQNQTTPSLPVSLNAGAIASITVNYDWTAGTTYYFRIASSAGQTLEFPEQAPA